ncbi:MAG: hypothetical protein F9K44_13980 [Hyphomicrobiaceae bacterium]|nr:MAG: hypothetical protein F9K44_13980 [Hyphomicrobiaceae bacterium]
MCLVDGRFRMKWIESGRPVAAEPEHRGFGMVVLDQITQSSLDGKVDIKFDANGLQWWLDCPAEVVVEHDSRQQRDVAAPGS